MWMDLNLLLTYLRLLLQERKTLLAIMGAASIEGKVAVEVAISEVVEVEVAAEVAAIEPPANYARNLDTWQIGAGTGTNKIFQQLHLSPDSPASIRSMYHHLLRQTWCRQGEAPVTTLKLISVATTCPPGIPTLVPPIM